MTRPGQEILCSQREEGRAEAEEEKEVIAVIHTHQHGRECAQCILQVEKK